MFIISQWEKLSSGAAFMFSLAFSELISVTYNGFFEVFLPMVGFTLASVNSIICPISRFFSWTTSYTSYYVGKFYLMLIYSILQTKCGFYLQFADSTYNLRIRLTVCGFRWQLRIPQQLNSTLHMSRYLFGDSTTCSGFRKTQLRSQIECIQLRSQLLTFLFWFFSWCTF